MDWTAETYGPNARTQYRSGVWLLTWYDLTPGTYYTGWLLYDPGDLHSARSNHKIGKDDVDAAKAWAEEILFSLLFS